MCVHPHHEREAQSPTVQPGSSKLCDFGCSFMLSEPYFKYFDIKWEATQSQSNFRGVGRAPVLLCPPPDPPLSCTMKYAYNVSHH